MNLLSAHIYVCGRIAAADQHRWLAPVAIVSITDPKSHPAIFDAQPPSKVVRLAFHDYPDDMPQCVIDGLRKDGHASELFDRTGAALILDEVLPLVLGGSTTRTLLVHCEAGLSRSVGVARALSRIFGDNEVPTIVHGVHPENTGNSRVVRELLEEAERRGVYRKPFSEDPPMSTPRPKLRFTD